MITLDLIPLNDYKKVRHSCTIYIVSFAVFPIYLQWYLRKNNVRIKFNRGTQTTYKWEMLK